jgi:aldose 1-epimerase
MTARITDYGATVQSISVPDRDGKYANVVLGFPRLSDYVNDLEHQPWPAPGGSGAAYFGALVGRYANRIAGGRLTIDGTGHELPRNDGENTLHGGPGAFSAQVWEADEGDGAQLRLRLLDPSGHNGFPGEMTVEVSYTVTAENALELSYRALSSEPTVVNLTLHTYFHLGGEGSGSALEHRLAVNAEHYLRVDGAGIPTGELAAVAGTPFDFRTAKPVGRDIRSIDGIDDGVQLTRVHGYDHNFVLNGSGLRPAAELHEPRSGRKLTIYTDQPGLQVYTANFLVGDLVGPAGQCYRQGDGIALETQHFPDSPHHPHFPSTLLRGGEEFRSETVYRFSVSEA